MRFTDNEQAALKIKIGSRGSYKFSRSGLELVSRGQTAYFSFDMGAKKNKRSGHARLALNMTRISGAPDLYIVYL